MGTRHLRYGVSVNTWDEAKEEARRAIMEVVSDGGWIFYSDLVKQIRSCDLEPYGEPLAKMLGEISTEEDIAGRGLLTAVVVRKEDGRPGRGFFDKLARDRGRAFLDTEADRGRLWVEELERVYGTRS